jgi:hypothetical protein
VRFWPAVAVALAVASLAASPTADAAPAPVCPNIPLPERLELADLAFVGSLVSSRTTDVGTLWRFDVAQSVKGTLGSEVELRAPGLVDSTGKPLVPGADVGVLGELRGATPTTDSCGLTDPAALLAVSDEARGNAIKLLLGILFLLGVVAYAVWRRRRRMATLGERGAKAL